MNGNDILSVGRFEKRYSGRLYNPNLGTGIVRQYLTLRSNGKVCAEGIDPNTGTQIKPTCVGYTDTSGHLYFTEENLSLETSTMSETNTTGIHR